MNKINLILTAGGETNDPRAGRSIIIVVVAEPSACTFIGIIFVMLQCLLLLLGLRVLKEPFLLEIVDADLAALALDGLMGQTRAPPGCS